MTDGGSAGTRGSDWRRIAQPRLRSVLEAIDHHAEAVPATAATLAGRLRPPITIDDIAPYIRFDAGNYVRSLVARGRRWEMRLLCWRPGGRAIAAPCSDSQPSTLNPQPPHRRRSCRPPASTSLQVTVPNVRTSPGATTTE